MLKILDEYLEESLVVVMMLCMTVLIVMQIFMRYVVGASLTWSEELARYFFIWATYIGVTYGVKKNAHICVEAVTSNLPEKLRVIVYVLAQVIFLVFAIFVSVEGFVLSMKIFSFGQTSSSLGMPMGFIYLAPTVGFALVFLRLLQNIWRAVLELRALKSGGAA